MITGRKILLAPIEPDEPKSSKRHFYAERRFCVVRKETAEMVGQVNYSGYTRAVREVEIGIEIDFADRGKGYGEDALYHFLRYLFEIMLVKKIKLAVLLNNFPARHLYQKLGFQEKEIVPEGGYDVETECFLDILLMELTEAHWHKACQHYSFKDDLLSPG